MPDQATDLRTLAAQQGIKPPAPDVDKARLWDDFKALLSVRSEETFVNGGRLEFKQSAIRAGWTLAEMEAMESAATFDRVREDMGGRG